MLRERTISKTYWAVVKNTPLKEKDSLIHFLKKNPKNNKSTVFTKETDASKKAILHYSVIKKLDNYSLLEIDLENNKKITINKIIRKHDRILTSKGFEPDLIISNNDFTDGIAKILQNIEQKIIYMPFSFKS